MLSRRGRIEDVLRDELLGKCVLPLEVVRASPRCQLAGPKEVFERDLAVAPTPPRPLFAAWLRQFTCSERTSPGNLRENVGHERWAFPLQAGDAAPRVTPTGGVHLPPHQWVQFDR